VNIYILIALFVIMVGTRGFVCCGKRSSTDDEQPVNMNSLRLFISAHLFPSSVPDDCVICTTCLWMHEKINNRVFFKEILLKIDNSREYNEMIDEGYPISLML
jgi:hypothetical protein